jgi:hypothetical protein
VEEVKFKVDQEITGGVDQAKATVRYAYSGGGRQDPQYLIEYATSGVSLLSQTYVEKNFKVVPEFFEVGHIYKMNSSGSEYDIKGVHELDSGELFAISLYTLLGGQQGYIILDLSDFKYVEEI